MSIKILNHQTTLTWIIWDFETISYTVNLQVKQKEIMCKEQTEVWHGKQNFLLTKFSFKQRFLSSTKTFSDSFVTHTGVCSSEARFVECDLYCGCLHLKC